MPLSPAIATVLTRAADRPDHRLEFSRRLPAVARRRMIEALLREGFIVGTADTPFTSDNLDREFMLTVLNLTDAGFRAIGRKPLATATNTAGITLAQTRLEVSGSHDSGKGAEPAPSHSNASVFPSRINLRSAAAALLTVWDECEAQPAALTPAIEHLRLVLSDHRRRRPCYPTASRMPREGTKQEAVLALLRREEGVNIAQIVAATAWAQHTVRGFLANLKRKGFAVEVAERVRLAGPSTAGAKGAYTVYRITTSAAG